MADDTTAGSRGHQFSLKPGDTARLDIILSKFPTTAVVAAGIAMFVVLPIVALATTTWKGGGVDLDFRSISTRYPAGDGTSR